MVQLKETEEGVHPSETPLCGQHDNQTKAQRSVKQQKPDSLVVSGQKCRVKSSDPQRLDFRDSSSSDSKKVATADRYSVLSSYSGLDSGESSSSDSEMDVATSDDDSDQSSCSRISLGSPASSESSCVSNQSKESTDRDIYFKKKLDSGESSSSDSEKDVATSDGDSSDNGEEEKTSSP